MKRQLIYSAIFSAALAVGLGAQTPPQTPPPADPQGSQMGSQPGSQSGSQMGTQPDQNDRQSRQDRSRHNESSVTVVGCLQSGSSASATGTSGTSSGTNRKPGRAVHPDERADGLWLDDLDVARRGDGRDGGIPGGGQFDLGQRDRKYRRFGGRHLGHEQHESVQQHGDELSLDSGRS